MIEPERWSKDVYGASVSSRCWSYTPYGKGWDGCPELRTDEVLRRLVEQELSLVPVPTWAQEIVERAINFPPFCPHWAFPQPYLEVLDAIGSQTPPGFVHGCYTASRERKNRMMDYVFCVDAWLAGASAVQAAAELRARGYQKTAWERVCKAIWNVLGERSELKELLVRRTLHRQRWWIKSLVWDDDRRDLYCQDQFLGDIRCPGNGYGHYGNSEFNDPYFAELQAPEVKRLEGRLSETCPEWDWFRSLIHDSWLCAPKAFRFLERLLWCIGKERRCISLPSHPLENGDKVPRFLECEDTYPDPSEARLWVSCFVSGMRSWLSRKQPQGPPQAGVHKRLGERTPMKSWLLGLYLKKIEFLNPFDGVQSD